MAASGMIKQLPDEMLQQRSSGSSYIRTSIVMEREQRHMSAFRAFSFE
jgi:hypothetical protein